MTPVSAYKLTSVADYLDGELHSHTKHEYLGGVVYAMAGATNRHNRIASNVTIALGRRIGDHGCEVFNSDTKVRVESPTQTRFYYPDASIVCDSNPDSDSYQDRPVVIVEVISDSTRRTDEGEKRDAYLMIPSLRVYLLIEQDRPAALAYRRADHGFTRETYPSPDATIPLPEADAHLPLQDIYRHITFPTDAAA